ncbi:hypothetical protein ACF0H5_007557 [Mactra antiquata]
MEGKNTTFIDKEDELSRLNSVELQNLIPLLFYLGIIAATGIPGNLIICLSYRQISQRSSSRFFIWWLAIVDTISCFVLFLEMVNVVHQFDFPNSWLCKLTIFSTLVPILTSGCSLCLISIDRFLRVCRPLKTQITVNKAKKMSIVTVGVALFFSWPSLILYGIHDTPIPGTNMTGRECTIQNKYQNSTSTMIYQSLLWLLFIASLGFLTVMYILIGKRIFAQMNSFSKKEACKNTAQELSIGSFDDTSTEACTQRKVQSESSLCRTSSCSQYNSKISGTVGNNSVVVIQRGRSQGSNTSGRQSKARKSAIIMGIISVVFIVSFLPYLILRALEAFDETFLVSMTVTERAVYKSFLRTYFLNCAINPFIYCACASSFREEIRAYFKRVITKFR